jgi:thiamine biosynthesis lipoprotein
MLQVENDPNIKNQNDAVSVEFKAFGTEIELRLIVNDFDVDSARKDLEEAREMYDYYAKIFSRFDENSELSILNKKIGCFNVASEQMLEVARHSLEFNKKTGGIFDPRIIGTLENVGYKKDFKLGEFSFETFGDEMDCSSALSKDLIVKGNEVFFGVRMDFSGIVKGFVTDKVSKFFTEKGWNNFLVDSGGDMYLSGRDHEGDAWRIDVDGVSYEKMMLELSGKGIATSGISKRKWEIDGRKFHHLINPEKRDQFMFDLKTVTVVAQTTEEADVWAKTLFLMGKNNGIIYARENLIPAVFLDYRGGAWISPEIKKTLYKS